MTFYDRSQDTNPCGVILGMPGAGKSFSAKREMESIWLGTQDDIYVLVIDRRMSLFYLMRLVHNIIRSFDKSL